MNLRSRAAAPLATVARLRARSAAPGRARNAARLRARIAAPLAGVTLALALAGSGLLAPAPALASNGYIETETTTYTVNPDAGRLDVAIDIDFTNTKPAYYFSGVYVWAEHAATDLRATAGGTSASVRHVRRTGGFDEYAVEFASVYYGQTRRIHVTYRVPGGAPRSSSSIRIGKAIASFCVVSQGDDGGTTKVVIPSAYKVTITGGSSDQLKPVSSTGTSGGGTGTATWSTGKLDLPYDFWSCLSATNESGYATASITSPGGREVDLESWPEDPKWKTEVEGELTTILPTLETLVGRELPGHGAIVLREVAGSELGAYAGFYDPVTQVIVLGEYLGQGGTVAHELSHAWFNGQALGDTWMSEGMAEWARISTVPDRCPAPASYPGQGSPNLTNWQFAGPRATTTDIAVVDYQYEAACYIVSTLAAKAGPDRWRAVINDVLENQLAYQTPGLVLTRPKSPVTWREWLDAVDELGLVPAGVSDLDYAQNLLAQYGVATDSATLGNRSRARAHYHKLLRALGAWTMPEVILRAMSTWSFGIAESEMGEADAILASVAKADAALPGADAEDGPVRMLFEQAKSVDDLRAAAAFASDQAAAADAVAAAAARVASPRDLLTQLGLSGADLDGPMAAAAAAVKAGDTNAAQADVAQVSNLLDSASEAGTLRLALGVALGLAALLVLAFVAFRLRRRRRLASVRASVTAPPFMSESVSDLSQAPAPPPEVLPGTEPQPPQEVPPGTGP